MIKSLLFIAALTLSALPFTAKCETLESHNDWNFGQFSSVSGENPDPTNCFYLGTAPTPNVCLNAAGRQGYVAYRVSHAVRSFQHFNFFQFGSENTLACFGCQQ